MSTTTSQYCSCCCPDMACFQQWTVTYDCNANAFGAVTSVEKTCLAKNTDTSWTKSMTVDGNCIYYRYVPMMKCCASVGTCTELADTAVPALPTEPCCCSGKYCFVPFMCYWDCDLSAWSDVTNDNATCMTPADNPYNDWTYLSSSGNKCYYQINVQTDQCCTINSDCNSVTIPDAPNPPANHDDCTCCTSNKKCFVLWYTTWDCPTGAWSTPVADSVHCLAIGTSTAWTAVDGVACDMQKYVAVDPVVCCDDDEGCADATTDQPDTPTCSPNTNCCQTATGCPQNCDVCCCSTYTLTLNNPCLTGSIAGTYDLTFVPDTSCTWGAAGIQMGCVPPQTVEGIYTAGHWILAISGLIGSGCSCTDSHGGYIFTAPSNGKCPPTSSEVAWTLIENTCDPAQTVTLTMTLTKSGCP